MSPTQIEDVEEIMTYSLMFKTNTRFPLNL